MYQDHLPLLSNRSRVYSELVEIAARAPDRERVPPIHLLKPGGGSTCNFAILDVDAVFAAEEARVVLPASVRRILVVGLREDVNAVLAAAAEGVPVFVLEDLKLDALMRMLSLSAVSCEPYAGFSRLSADRVRRLLQRRQERRMLTHQESTILTLVLKGRTNPQIAQALGIETKTVKNHVTHLLSKLGVSNRLEAMARNEELASSYPQRPGVAG